MTKMAKTFIRIILFVAVIILVPCYFALADDNPITGNYFGAATIDSPAGLSNIDLAFHLEFDAGGNIDPGQSYILLDKTILFPKVGQIGGQDVGPAMESGYFHNPEFHLISQTFTNEVNNRTVTRRITMDGNATSALGNTISGIYTETMNGYLPDVINVMGTFVLFRPVSMTQQPLGCKYLDTLEPIGELTLLEIQSGGTNPYAVEFEDLSCAMYYHQHPELGIMVSDSTMSQAIIAYKVYLEAQP